MGGALTLRVALAVHGGAWNIPDDTVAAHAEGVRTALEHGWRALKRVGGRGGVILLDRKGRAAAAFNSPRMARGIATIREGVRISVDPVKKRR